MHSGAGVKVTTSDQVTVRSCYVADTEGHDLEVLKSIDFKRYHPLLIVIEYGENKSAIAEILAREKPMAVVWAMGITQHRNAVATVKEIDAVVIATPPSTHAPPLQITVPDLGHALLSQPVGVQP